MDLADPILNDKLLATDVEHAFSFFEVLSAWLWGARLLG